MTSNSFVICDQDTYTSRWVVDECFKGDLIKGRTVILVVGVILFSSPTPHQRHDYRRTMFSWCGRLQRLWSL